MAARQKRPINKADLIGTVHVARRQLERYLFYFERGSDGDFVASDRPKFSNEEMLQPGVVDDWSMKDVLAHLIDWESRFIDWYHAGLTGSMPDAPTPHIYWESLDISEQEIPADLCARSAKNVLTTSQQSYQRIVSMLDAIPEHDLFTPGRFAWTGGATVADYVALVTYKHYDWAKKHIRHWRKTHAGTYLNKQAILERIQTEHGRLENNLETLSEGQMEVAGVVGEWSVKDLVAHLVDWEQRFIGWYDAGLRGEVPEVPAPGIGWDELDILNQRIYERNRNRDLEDVLRDFRESYEHVLALVRAIPEDDIFAIGRYAWLGDGNLAGYILANTANHYRWAKTQIRKWLRTWGG